MEVSNEVMAGCGIVERFQNKLVVEHAFVCLRAESRMPPKLRTNEPIQYLSEQRLQGG
jgi:hypothetical protein